LENLLLLPFFILSKTVDFQGPRHFTVCQGAFLGLSAYIFFPVLKISSTLFWGPFMPSSSWVLTPFRFLQMITVSDQHMPVICTFKRMNKTAFLVVGEVSFPDLLRELKKKKP